MPGHRIPDDKKVVVKSLVDAGMPYRKIQEITSVSPASITNIVKEFEANKELVEYYKKNRGDILAHDQMLYRSYITPEKLEKASARDLETMRAIAFDKERLERGQTTENVGLAIYQMIQEYKKRKNEDGEALDTEKDKPSSE
jgi:DNA-binding Lrp family transcriptional regulator